MPRSGVEARRRLETAALALYAAHGYDDTTTADITATAGVSLRTFFRHFADKREIIFGGEDAARDALSHAVSGAPSGLAPLDVLLHAFLQAATGLDEDADAATRRLRIIAANPALHERDLAKAAMLTDALGVALQRRGVPAEMAGLLAAMGWAAYREAASHWMDEPGQTLAHHLRTAFMHLHEAVRSAVPVNPPGEPED